MSATENATTYIGVDIVRRRPHCWMDRTEHAARKFGLYSPQWWLSFSKDHGETCMEWDGHRGPHRWVRDDRIGIRLVEAVEPAKGAE